MRFLRLLPLVLLALAAPARAQTAADSALVREVIQRMDLDRQFGLFETITETMIAGAPARVAPLRATPADLRKLEARLHRALLADPRPEHLRAIRDHLASGTVERSMALARELAAPDRLQALVMQPDSAALGDRDVALRLYRANRSADTERQTQEALIDYLDKSARLRARLAAAGVPPDAFLARLRAGIVDGGDGPTEAELLGARALVGRMDPADVDAAIAFGESDAARYLNETTSGPVVETLAQWMGAWMEGFFLALFDAADAERAAPGEAPGEALGETADEAAPPVEFDAAQAAADIAAESLVPTPVRDPIPDLDAPGASAAPHVFDVVEQEPVLAGGLDGLTARLVYPDDARLVGAEGTVYVRFVVDTDGRPRHLSAVGATSASLRAAALDVVQASRFTPGRQRGRAVRVRYTLPVRFTLR